MARDQLNTVVRHIRYVIGARQCWDTTDNDLVQRFAGQRDEAAFAGLLQRHGPMVLGVCRRVLRNSADADDAFQATFLVLVRKAGSIRKTASVGSWLHGVAFRVAREARMRTEKQRPGETPDVTGREPDPAAEAARRELCLILDQELARLPAKYRSPLVLHYLEGKTKEETARELGWTEGTVSGRLARARESLRKRLAGRNVSFSSGMMAAVLSEQAATTPVPVGLANATMQSALSLGAGALAGGAAAGASHTLAEAVLKSMLMSKLKHAIPLAIVLLAATVGLAVGGQRLLPLARPPVLPPDKSDGSGVEAGEAEDEPKSPALRIPRNRIGGNFKARLSPDCKTIAAAGPGTIKFFEVATGKELATLNGDTIEWLSVEFSPDNRTLASWGGEDGTVKLWEVATGDKLATLDGHTQRVYLVAFSPDGKTLAACSRDKSIKLWDVPTGRERFTLERQSLDLDVHAVAFSPDGKTLASLRRGGITLWDVATGKEQAALKLWDGVTDKKLFKGHTDGVLSMAFSPDSKTLASGSDDETIKLWEVATGKVQATLKGPTAAIEQARLRGQTFPVSAVVFSPDGKTLASRCAQQGLIKLWDVATGSERATLKGQAAYKESPVGESPFSGLFSPDSKTLALKSEDGTIKLWEVATGKEGATLDRSHNGGLMAFSPDGETLLGFSGGHLTSWEVATGKDRDQAILCGHTGRVFSVAFSPDGKTLASGSEDGTSKLWEVATGKDRATLKGHTQAVYSVAFSPDCKTLASASMDGTIKLWEVATGKELATLKGHTNQVVSVAFSPDGKTLASGSWDKTIMLWDVATGKEQATLNGHTSYVYSVAFSPDGKTLASGSADKTIELWDVATGKEQATLNGHTNNVYSVAFSPDSKTLASASKDGTIKFWEVATGKEQVTLKDSGWCWSVVFSPDGKTLASGCKLWEVSTGKEQTTLNGHHPTVYGVAFSPDGKTFASGDEDNTILLWDVRPQK
jgi:RNA polymerase sigma factor (sigma-70 family)